MGHQGLVTFAAAMNMPPPMNKNAYLDTEGSLKEAAKTIAEGSMAKAALQTKEIYEAGDDGITNVAMSEDGTWRRRGFKSSFGVVTAISVTTGKILDSEIMSKEWRTCLLNKRKEGTPEFEEW